MSNDAVISADGWYRYRLERDVEYQFGQQPGGLGTYAATIAFIMVNPSTADASADDPTIRRCLGFARREKCWKLVVGNLFAFRATDVKDLTRKAQDPVGRDNDHYLRQIAREARLIVLGWGPLAKQPPLLRHQWRHVVGTMQAERPDATPLMCLGVAKDGHPRHPLMLAADAPLEPWYPPGDPMASYAAAARERAS